MDHKETQNQETKITTKGPQRIDNFFGETWLLTKLIRIQKLKWHKHNVITTRKQQEILKNNLKTERKQQECKVLELKVSKQLKHKEKQT